MRLVLVRPRTNVLKWVGRRLRRLRVFGGGRRMEFMPWITPFVAGCCG